MEYTFKEAFDEIDEKAFYIEKDETWANVSSSVVYLVTDLQETYAPKIGLTKLGKKRLLYYLETSNLHNFMEYAYNNMQLYNGVSWEELAQAWLHPENIETVGKI